METLRVYKIGLIEYIDFKNCLNLENPITNESVDPYSPVFFATPRGQEDVAILQRMT